MTNLIAAFTLPTDTSLSNNLLDPNSSRFGCWWCRWLWIDRHSCIRVSTSPSSHIRLYFVIPLFHYSVFCYSAIPRFKDAPIVGRRMHMHYVHPKGQSWLVLAQNLVHHSDCVGCTHCTLLHHSRLKLLSASVA